MNPDCISDYGPVGTNTPRAQPDVPASDKTLRDEIAIAAMAGHLASLNAGSWGNDIALAMDVAQGAYLVADAMLDERAKAEGRTP